MMIHVILKIFVVVLYVQANSVLDSDIEDTIKRSSSCGVPSIEPSDIQARIIGGTYAVPGSWPWQVLLLHRDKALNRSAICGGSIITKRHILTAAHCFENAKDKNDWTVYVGGHYTEASSQEFSVKGISYYHGTIALDKDYPPQGWESFKDSHHDIAMIKLEKPLKFSDKVMRVCLPMADDVVDSKTVCVATGYGRIHPKLKIFPMALKQVTAPIVPKEECKKLHYQSDIADTMICAGHKYGGKDTCVGDSGGPLVCYTHNRWILYGVTSIGPKPCAKYGSTSIYTYVPKYVGWIHQIRKSRRPNVFS